MLALGFEGSDVLVCLLVSYDRPVLLADVVVNLDCGRVEGIHSVFTASGDPIVAARVDIEVVRLEASPGECLKSFASVVE